MSTFSRQNIAHEDENCAIRPIVIEQVTFVNVIEPEITLIDELLVSAV